MYLIAADIGFGHIKVMSAVVDKEQNQAKVMTKEIIPSAIRLLHSGNDFKISEHVDYVRIKDKEYLVGYSALISDKSLRVRTSEFMLENLPVYLQRILKFKLQKPDILILGTPFQEWKRLKDKFIQTGREFAEKVYCIPQAAASGLVVDTKGSKAVVLDIGFNTCDAVPLDNNGRIIADEGKSWEKTGISTVLDELNDYLKNLFGYSPSPADLENIIKKPKSIKKYFPEITEDMINSFLKNFDSIVKDKFWFINAKLNNDFGYNFGKLILVGGGANVFKKEFKRVYSKNLIIPKDCQFANVKGFLLYGLSVSGFKGNILWDYNKEIIEMEHTGSSEVLEQSEQVEKNTE